MKDMIFKYPLNHTEIVLEASFIGEDLVLHLYGGEKPHIGTVILAQPRPSLYRDSRISATSSISILNIVGHKDEYACRKLAEKAAAELQTNVVCTGGIHIDDIAPAQIEQIIKGVDKLSAQMIQQIRFNNPTKSAN